MPTVRRITELAPRIGLPELALEPCGHRMAKLSHDALAALPERAGAQLVLVTAISPTPAGEGKTTTTIGLGDALQRLGKRVAICLRQPSLGPVFGMKGGATGGGRAQLVPMEDINLHFTGDFHAIAAAHNLLAALLDNHLQHGNALGIDVRRVHWKRVIDINDRALRRIAIGLGGAANGVPREDGFDIVAASEVMAVFCLATSLADMKQRLGDIVVAQTHDLRPVRARELKAEGAMTALLRNAFQPNLVQTLEGTPALVHGGPFGNIAHGCNSVVATRAALKLADIVVTEAGFGADLGAEKFVDIKCRTSGLRPQLAVLVASVRALKMHGGSAVAELEREDVGALERGLPNLERHLDNLRRHFGIRSVVAINRFPSDTAAELAWLQQHLPQRLDVPVAVSDHFAEGGAGALELGQAVLDALAQGPAEPLRFAYDDALALWDKARAVATKLYGAADIAAPAAVRARLDELQAQGCASWPVCIAKTPYSFSTDPTQRGAPSGHVLDIREVRLAAGARFVVLVCGDIMTMPGLPKAPAAERIDVADDGRIVGLF